MDYLEEIINNLDDKGIERVYNLIEKRTIPASKKADAFTMALIIISMAFIVGFVIGRFSV